MTYTPPYGYYMSNNPVCMGVYSSQAGMDACTCRLKLEGTGTVRVEPDVAAAVLGVVTEGLQLGEVQRENAAKIAQVVDTLVSMGVDKSDIQTQAYTIEPRYDYVEGKQIFRGYRVVHNLSVTIREPARSGDVIDAAVRSGANTVGSIRFSVTEPGAYYRQALSAAVEDAQYKAVALGGRMGIQISRVPCQVTEMSSSLSPVATPYMLQAAEAATPVQPGQLEITARVETVFCYG